MRPTAAPERGAARQGARASGPRRTSARLPGGGVDVREGCRGYPQRVRGRLPSGSRREPVAQSSGPKLAETPAPSEPAGRGGHRALEGREVALPQKRALKEGRTIVVFADQSGFYLLPSVV